MLSYLMMIKILSDFIISDLQMGKRISAGESTKSCGWITKMIMP